MSAHQHDYQPGQLIERKGQLGFVSHVAPNGDVTVKYLAEPLDITGEEIIPEVALSCYHPAAVLEKIPKHKLPTKKIPVKAEAPAEPAAPVAESTPESSAEPTAVT